MLIPDIVWSVTCYSSRSCMVFLDLQLLPRYLQHLFRNELPAFTVIFPFCPAVPVVTVIDVVPAPAVIDQPAGTVHV